MHFKFVIIVLLLGLVSCESPLLARVRSHVLHTREVQQPDLISAAVSRGGQQVRLAGGAGPWQGAVQVYTPSGWAPVAADRWTETEAAVVCSQLGHVSYFTKSPEATTASDVGAGDKPLYGVDSCSGEEASIQECARSASPRSGPVSVTCLTSDDLTARCRDGWVPFGDSCYLIAPERLSRLRAEAACRQHGASLPVVRSQLENDFLSELAVSGGVSSFHTSGISHQLVENVKIWAWKNSSQPFRFTKWFSDDEGSATADLLEQRCLLLELSGLEDGSQYAFWVPSDCSTRSSYVCQTTPTWPDCIRGSGIGYVGTVNTAESGRQCLPWADVLGSDASAALVGNFCRNPDGDRQPWCYTSPGRLEYCDLPACPPLLPEPETDRGPRVPCFPPQFACSPDECVKKEALCDGKRDCSNGRDEHICEALYANFEVFTNSSFGLRTQEDLKALTSRVAASSGAQCRYLCQLRRRCHAAVYLAAQGACFLSLAPVGYARVKRLPGAVLYLSLGRYRDCGGPETPAYRCRDLACLGKPSARCDGVPDCDDTSDETGCEAQQALQLRLVGGDSAAAGRLEARLLVGGDSAAAGRLEARLLVGGDSAAAGRLEARLRGGPWGLVCDNFFQPTHGTLACRQLGFRRMRHYYVNGRGFAAGGERRFALHEVACYGNETRLSQCVLLGAPDSGSCSAEDCRRDPLPARCSLRQCLLLTRHPAAGRCGPGEHVSLECTDEPGLCDALPHHLPCRDGAGCVRPQLLCNGKADCADGSDEGPDVCDEKKPPISLVLRPLGS